MIIVQNVLIKNKEIVSPIKFFFSNNHHFILINKKNLNVTFLQFSLIVRKDRVRIKRVMEKN